MSVKYKTLKYILNYLHKLCYTWDKVINIMFKKSLNIWITYMNKDMAGGKHLYYDTLKFKQLNIWLF